MNIKNFDYSTQPKRPDPFGRLMTDDGSQDRFKALENITTLSGAVGPDEQNDPDDVAKAEIMMGMAGELNLSETDGPTGYYSERLRQAIVAYQKKNTLPQSGVLHPSDATMAVLAKAIAPASHSDVENRQGAARFQI